MTSTLTPTSHAFPQLDGWRGLSILLVLAGHLLPLGPKNLHLNAATAAAGMSIFFTLSGFLITRTLLQRTEPGEFFIRRFSRIIPLAYLYLLIVLPIYHANATSWLAHFGFYANIHHSSLVPLTGHLWSLCVEMQFYIAIGLIAWLGKRRAIVVCVPVLLLAATACRLYFGGFATIETYRRVDEILTGACLSLAYSGQLGTTLPRIIGRLPISLISLATFTASHEYSGGIMNASRGYFTALMVGRTLFDTQCDVSRALANKQLRYIATISYALYVLHPLVFAGWMGSGTKVVVYVLKRPLGFVILCFLAHLSSFYYEKRWTDWARSTTSRRSRSTAPPATVAVVQAIPDTMNHNQGIADSAEASQL